MNKQRVPPETDLKLLADDVFLVSYPRSGNTWARFLLANLLGFAERTVVDFHSVQRLIPDLHSRAQREFIKALPSPRIIKSHYPFTPAYHRVIYVLRDGRDVAVSYFDYLTKQNRFEGTLARFLAAGNLPYGPWHAHVESWLAAQETTDMLLVRYEDLLADARRELARMARFIGLTTTAKQLDYAVEKSSFIQMQQIEAAKGRPFDTSGYRFVRRGVAGQWPEQFDSEAKAIFKAQANPTLLKLGYATTPDW
ncbi:MAG: sulfotransferase domain-containing protein [Anaerolineae bacterium]